LCCGRGGNDQGGKIKKRRGGGVVRQKREGTPHIEEII